MRAGIANCSIERMKVSTRLEVIEKPSSGRVTRRNTPNGVAPAARAASSNVASIPRMGPRIIK